MKKTIFGFLGDQLSKVPHVPTADLTGKIVVVVGANTGIGFEAAKHFARMNPAKLILACRSESKGQAAALDIQSTTGLASCETWKVDLSNFASVNSFAQRFQQECDRLDILVMNAAIQSDKYEETVNGWESTLQVNHLGTALLSLLLLPRLVETGKRFGSTSRAVIVASEVHYGVVLPDNVKNAPNPVGVLSGYRDASSMRRRYFDSKLLNVLFARALQDRLQSITPVTVNSVNPGFCRSNLRNNMRGFFLNVSIGILEALVARTSEQGSRQLVYAAIGGRDNEEHMKGAYVNSMAVDEPSDFVISEEGRKMQDCLWAETTGILTKEAPQLTLIMKEYLV